MQINRYELLIPVSPDSINKVCTYGKREGDIVVLKRKWEKIALPFIEEAIINGILPVKFLGRISVFYRLFFETERMRDGDNYALMCKGITDALVVSRLVPDDNIKYIDDDGRRLRLDPGRARVEVIIKEKFPDDSLVSIDYNKPKNKLVAIKYAR